MELIKLSGLNPCNLNHERFSSIFSSFRHEKTFNSQVLVSLLTCEACWESYPSILEPKWDSLSSMAKVAKWGILLQTVWHNSKGQNGVTVTSKSQPPMALLFTHACRLGPHYFPWLKCMAGSFLTENRTVCLRKVQLPQLRRSETLPPFTSLPAAPSLPLSLSCWFSLDLSCVLSDS